METYRAFFGFEKEPFPTNLAVEDILVTESLRGVKERFDYALRLGGIALVTGEIGSGKSTALRYSAGMLHPSEYKVFAITACTGSIIELYRQIMTAMTINRTSNSKAVMTTLIRKEIREKALQKINPVLIIDEASLLRMEVLGELHTLCQFDQDSHNFLPMILAGHASLVDKLSFSLSAPLASRIIARTHLDGLNLESIREYLAHHLKLAGVEANLFEDAAVTAIHQASGGLLRKINHLARGAFIAAAKYGDRTVTAEHVRISSTEIF